MVFLLLLIFYYSCYRVTRQGVEDSIGWLETIKQTKCSVCWIFVWIFTILHHSRLLLSNISNSQHNIFYIPSRHPFITSVFSVNPAASQVAVLFEPRVLYFSGLIYVTNEPCTSVFEIYFFTRSQQSHHVDWLYFFVNKS